MRLPVLALSCSLPLAACGQPPTLTAPPAGPVPAVAGKSDVLSVKVPRALRFVTAALTGGTLVSPHTFTAVPRDGAALLDLSDLPHGKCAAVLRAYDNADRAVVLYRASTEGTTSGNRPLTAPALTRVTATVTASPLLPQSTTLTARLGGTAGRTVPTSSGARRPGWSRPCGVWTPTSCA
ncbi:hypothetical protein [Deinococcus aetherius]|uniref:hypothetical protein n=1 Tax=Deinococcus aetherius TaxID=200252 RepID=UPI002230D216|nr:hypothetical protein [Deinococcus aetherius]